MPELNSVTATDRVDETRVVGDHSLQKLIQMMLLEKLDSVDQEAREEVGVLTDRQKRIEFLNQYLRELNSAIDNKNGSVERDKMQGLIDEGLEMKAEADARMIEADEIQEEIDRLASEEGSDNKEIAKLEKKRDWLRESAEEIYTILQACDIIDNDHEVVTGPVSYNETATSRLQENIRSYSKILQTRNNTQSQMVQRLNNERNEALLLAKDIQRTIHEIMKRIASNISR